jgi:hypothetical protein
MSEEEVGRLLEQAVHSAVLKSTASVVGDVLHDAPRAFRKLRRLERGFERRLRGRWRAGLDLFRLTLLCCQEWGGEFNSRYRLEAARDQDYAFEALTRLQARACLTGSEILALLRTGHAAGAEARWRTLHELSVVAQVIARRDEGIAERYLEHEVIEQAKDAEEYESFRERLGYEPWDPSNLAELRRRREQLVRRYGKPFQRNYGWAAPLFSGRTPEFGQLEELAGVDHLRPFRTLGTRRVHAGSRGAAMGLLRRGPHRMLHAGPTNHGLADPGHGSLISLAQTTVALFTAGRADQEDVTWTVHSSAILELVERAGDAFLAAHKRLDDDERRVWADRPATLGTDGS